MLSRRALTARELRVFLVMAYPSAVFAASGALGNQFDQWTARSFAALALLIAVGGLTGLAHRLAGELEVWGELRYPKSLSSPIASAPWRAGCLRYSPPRASALRRGYRASQSWL